VAIQPSKRALDAGRSAPDLLSSLTGIADGPLPQPLEYLIADIGRRHGLVTVVPSLCCLRSEDTALLREICADRLLAGLDVRPIAPTVAISGRDMDTTLVALRAAGYLPSADLDTAAADLATTAKPPATIDLEKLRKDYDLAVDQLRDTLVEPKGQAPADEKTLRRRARVVAEALRDGSAVRW
jgi:hypothetical protein